MSTGVGGGFRHRRRPVWGRPARAAVVAMGLMLAPMHGAGAQQQRRSPRPRTIHIVARDYAFDMPDTLRAGVATLRLRNDGREAHHVMLFRLDAGRSRADVAAVLAHDAALPPWMHAVGGPNAVVGHRESVVTLALAPGTYVAYCFIPSPDRVLHVAKGMIRMVTVVPAAGAPARLPRGDVAVTLLDYGFRFSRPLTAGHHRLSVTNRGKQPHELILSRLVPGKHSRDFVRWIEQQGGPPPVEPYGGVTDISPGETVVIDVDLAPGRYSVLCRVRDEGDDRPHDRHGMVAEIEVKP